MAENFHTDQYGIAKGTWLMSAGYRIPWMRSPLQEICNIFTKWNGLTVLCLGHVLKIYKI